MPKTAELLRYKTFTPSLHVTPVRDPSLFNVVQTFRSAVADIKNRRHSRIDGNQALIVGANYTVCGAMLFKRKD
ncbi:MAG: hypothetical protein ACXU9G_07140, partial [Syntrophales bacterium]